MSRQLRIFGDYSGWYNADRMGHYWRMRGGRDTRELVSLHYIAMITVVCPTFGRPRGVCETIACFLSQDCRDARLVIVNDHPEQTLLYAHERVTVINKPERYPSLGEKRQAILESLPSGLWTTWDDDDIYLPNYLSYSLMNHQRFRTSASKHWWHWIDSGKRLYRISPAAWMNTVLCDRDIVLDVGGFKPGTNNTCVPVIAGLLKHRHLVGPAHGDGQPPTFIYRLGDGKSHCCMKDEANAYAETAAAADTVRGEIVLQPFLADDYAAKALASWNALQQGAP